MGVEVYNSDVDALGLLAKVLVLFFFPLDDHPHYFIVDIRVRHRRALDVKLVAVDIFGL